MIIIYSPTISSFCSFVLLVLMKMFNSFTVSRESLKNDKMMIVYDGIYFI